MPEPIRNALTFLQIATGSLDGGARLTKDISTKLESLGYIRPAKPGFFQITEAGRIALDQT